MKSTKLLFAIIIFVACSGQISSDINAPSLPAITLAFNTQVSSVQLSMAMFMVGLALSQLIYGPLSEAFGRRKPLLIGLSIFLAGNVACVFSTSILMLILGRFIQGCGAGACAALWRSIFRDAFEGDELARYGAYFSIFITFIIPVMPTIGGYLQHYFDWRACFLFLSLYATCTLTLVTLAFKETSRHHHRDRLKHTFIYQSFRQLLSSRVFMSYSLCTFLCYGAFFSWFSIGPVLLIHKLGMSPVRFGWLTLGISGVATIISGWVNAQLVVKLGAAVMMRTGLCLMLIAGGCMLMGYVLFGIQTLAILIPLFLFYFGVTFIWPSAFTGAFTPFGHIAGYAGALFGSLQIGGAAVLGVIVAYLPHDNQLPLALLIMLTAVLAWWVFEQGIGHQKVDVALVGAEF